MDTHRFGLAAASLGLGVVACAVVPTGCAPFRADPAAVGEREGEGEGEGEDERVAVVRLELTGTGMRSVHVRGSRRLPADAKYPCSARFDVCVDFDAAGGDAIRDLCPSVDLAPFASEPSPSPWDFDFVVYDDQRCSGSAVTGGEGATLVCYAASSLGVVGTENKLIGEILAPGVNSAQVICIARRAE